MDPLKITIRELLKKILSQLMFNEDRIMNFHYLILKDLHLMIGKLQQTDGSKLLKKSKH